VTVPETSAAALPLVDLHRPAADRLALSMPDGALTYGELRQRVAETAEAVSTQASPGSVVAVPAVARTTTVIGLLGALGAGCAVVPVNTGSGPDELAHVLADSSPLTLVAPDEVELPETLSRLPRTWAPPHPSMPDDPTADGPDRPGTGTGAPAGDVALIVYTSGTTGPPKGVALSHRALAADLDALAMAWDLSADDVWVHALPLFHVHGLVLATLGPLRIGGTVHHIGRYDPRTVATVIADGATVHYGVPTMHHRLADAMAEDPSLARDVARVRLLVSGSAGLAAHDRDRITAATGLAVLERYGMTETLITCAATVAGRGEPGSVGPPLPGVGLRLVDDDGTVIDPDDHDTVGEIHVVGPTLFDGYLGRPDATEACYTPDGWFRTGDLATWSPSGSVRISGRRSVDLIKSGGYRIGAGEIENVLLGHPQVAEVAVTGQPDPDLGERIVAWVVAVAGTEPTEADLIAHVGDHLARHKRPRQVRFVDQLPRNELGKVLKRALG